MTLRQRQQPHRDRAYLDLAYLPDARCMSCGERPCDPAHYSGLYADQVSKSGASKASDAVSMPLCRRCHTAFDMYALNNDDSRAAWGLLNCWKWLLWLIDQGHVELRVLTLLRPSEGNVSNPRLESAGALKASAENGTARRPNKPRRRSPRTNHANGHSTETPSKIFKRPRLQP